MKRGIFCGKMNLTKKQKVSAVDLIGMGLATHGPSSSTISSMASYMRNAELQQNTAAGGVVMDEAKLRELRRRRNLLVLLVGHEIERIAVWNNPLNRIPLQIEKNESLKFKYEELPKSLKCLWKDCIFIIDYSPFTYILNLVFVFLSVLVNKSLDLARSASGYAKFPYVGGISLLSLCAHHFARLVLEMYVRTDAEHKI
jgi:hypothetical protein